MLPWPQFGYMSSGWHGAPLSWHRRVLIGASAFSNLELTILPIFSKPLCIIARMSSSLELSLSTSEACGIRIGAPPSLVSVGEFSSCGAGGLLASRFIGSVSAISERLGEGQWLVLWDTLHLDHKMLIGSGHGFFGVHLASMASCSSSALHCACWALRSALKAAISMSDFKRASVRILSVCSYMASRSLVCRASTCSLAAS